ncbi:CPBP family intramembrane glutamic endopeptidase [Loigolactobacillus bifermentans]|uniref:CAAX prenyl protease 2/Lysostaphin resistance protein A-like domain-containing protein n=1 Tax=Loigolactobacillus bifermentans DSM 20003 TaxID=1423726 RepID=A0A0R1H603_9LACO|nr:CPBP family intramembrane glutamic endopeptidase [Loigolactobacillus bifermentans]KRK39042.1 hypothetical protein FC07_GL002762 [Loigolactobacillus bifermentans DSM 20003]QGG59069.1 CPBP family intramembrane metalloprotease [Loigolactobacillus bifermentans]
MIRQIERTILLILLFIGEQLPSAGLQLAGQTQQFGTGFWWLVGSLFLLIMLLITVLYWQLYRHTLAPAYQTTRRRLQKKDYGWFGLGFVAMVIVNASTLPFMQQSGNTNVDNISTLMTLFGVFTLIYLAILGPILEEIIFRGLLMNWFFSTRPAVAIGVSAIVFGTMHVNLFGGQLDLVYWLSKILLGGILATVYWRTKRLKTTIWLHILNNALPLVLGI